MNIKTYLRLRPLEQKHKLKEDYFSIKGSKEEEKSSLPHSKSSIFIHDPLKRSKDQFEFKFDKIFTQECSNAQLYKDVLSPLTAQNLRTGTSTIVFSFGFSSSGKTYTLLGENNLQIEKSITDPIQNSDDSRGLILRCIHDIQEKDPKAKITYTFCDLILENIRDLLKYAQKEHKKANAVQGGYEQENHLFAQNQRDRPPSQAPSQNQYDQSLTIAQNIEKDYLEIHEKPSFQGTTYYLKNQTSNQVKDLSEVAYFIEKGSDMTNVLNKKVNYTVGLRHISVFNLNVMSSSGKQSSIIFVDLADFEKLQTNIIDNQKLYESIVLNNTMNAITKMLGGFNKGQFNLKTAPYESSKLTRIIQSHLQASNAQTVNVAFICCLWPTESKYSEVINTLKFVDRIKVESDVMVKSDYQGEMSTNQEKIMQDFSKENVDLKFRIDTFKREHQARLNELRQKIGFEIPVDSILKTKNNQKELQVVKEHKEAIEKTENFGKQNKEIEKKLEQIQRGIEDDDMAKREIQESFSQKYYIIQKKIDKLKEEFKQSEMELDNTVRGQVNDRNEELQKVLNHTHAIIIENSSLCEQLTETVVKKQKIGTLPSKKINFMKDEGKKVAEDNYMKLFSQQEREIEQQILKTKEKYECLLKKKEDETRKATEEFRNFHDQIKNEQRIARSEIVKLYNIAKKQNQILTNIENGVYSQTAKRLKFNELQKPSMPDSSKFKFLFNSLERSSQKSYGSASTSFVTGIPQPFVNNAQTSIQDNIDLRQNVDSVVNPEALRSYVTQLMEELSKHSNSHPQLLKGENVDQILQDIEKHKKAYDQANKKNNDIRIQIEAQKRLIDRVQLEKIPQPIIFK